MKATHKSSDMREVMADPFRGDNSALVSSIWALLGLDAAGALAPHPLGGHARTLLESAAARLSTPAPAAPDRTKELAWRGKVLTMQVEIGKLARALDQAAGHAEASVLPQAMREVAARLNALLTGAQLFPVDAEPAAPEQAEASARPSRAHQAP